MHAETPLEAPAMLSHAFAQVFRNSSKPLHMSWDIPRRPAFFLQKFCILLLPAHSGGAIMRRLDWRSGCGACGWFRKPSPGASGLLPGPTTRARRVADAPGRTQAEACGIRPKGRSGCRTEQSRRQKPPRWSAERRACLARHAPRLASVELLMRLSALRSLGFEGYRDTKTGAPAA